MKYDSKPIIKNKKTIIIALFVSFVITLLYRSFFIIFGNSRNSTFFDFIIPYIFVAVSSFIILNFYQLKKDKTNFCIFISSIVGLGVVLWILLYVPQQLSTTQEIINNSDKWAAITFYTIVSTIFSMSVIASIINYYLSKKKERKMLPLLGKPFLLYLLLTIIVVIVGTVWGVMTNSVF